MPYLFSASHNNNLSNMDRSFFRRLACRHCGSCYQRFFPRPNQKALKKMLVVFVSSQYLTFAVLFILYYGITHLGTLLPMPQWSVFLLMPALALAGLRSRKIKQVEKPS
ncbi:MAG TPA: hypothetical protein ENI94_08495 [Gammaproteobacteria bacterium]|nr:hypothetical protein [Gammaproteobacteria bacterium]